MPNYQNSKIYTIRHPDTEQYYLGSTTQALSERFRGHKKDNNNTTSKQLFDLGIDQCYIELLENYPCNSVEELTKREGELIRLHKANLVNYQIPGRTKKQYLEEHKEYLNEKRKIYYQTNKEILLEKQKTHRENIKELIQEQSKLYYLNNKEIIAEKRSNDFICDCGSTYKKQHKTRHEKSKKHQLFINQPTI